MYDYTQLWGWLVNLHILDKVNLFDVTLINKDESYIITKYVLFYLSIQ